MVKVEECKNCIHEPVCSYTLSYNDATKKATDELDKGVIILDVRCFFYHQK